MPADGPGAGASAAALEEGEDFYRDEQGRTVFTEHHNRRRGFCCFLACRHCPWGQAGRTPTQAFADLQRRLDTLEERLAGAGLPLELRGYRNGVLSALPPAAACATDLPGAERLVRREAQSLLTVLRVDWA
jgi:hypothetical protein